MNDQDVNPARKEKENGGEDSKTQSESSKTADSSSPEKSRQQNVFYRFLQVHTKHRGVVLGVTIVLWLGSVGGSIYLCWFYLIPIMWNWGFYPETTWRAILAVLGAFYVGIAPVLPLTFGWDAVQLIMSGYVDERQAALKSKLRDLSKHQKSAEERLEAEDKTGLIPLITYSRIQLESYYTIGLSQTQRSFRYSILAMWIGFVVILGGMSLYLLPSVFPNAVTPPADLQIITIAGGVVIEIISALFLWIYRSSINQLNYFYSRQMHIHNVLLCDRIASSMSKQDDTKHLIVERVLGSVWDVKPLPAPGKGISKLINVMPDS